MKISQLFEVFEFVPEPKLKKVKSFLTPELTAQHHDLICQALAKFVPAKEIDVMQAAMLDKNTDPEMVSFVLKMLQKQLADIGAKVVNNKVQGGLPPINDEHGHLDFAFYFDVRYEKSKWEVYHDKVGYRFGSTTKRFDDPKEIAPYLRKMIVKFEKLRADIEEMRKKKNEGK